LLSYRDLRANAICGKGDTQILSQTDDVCKVATRENLPRTSRRGGAKRPYQGFGRALRETLIDACTGVCGSGHASSGQRGINLTSCPDACRNCGERSNCI
jgi:hypothetical protein